MDRSLAPHEARPQSAHNVADPERVLSVAIGAALVTMGLRRRDTAGIAAAIIGGGFLYRGSTGHCGVYEALGVSTGDSDAVLDAPRRRGLHGFAATVNARKAIQVDRSVTIERDAADLYDFWRGLTRLPEFMEHLESVTTLPGNRTHWKAKAPGGGTVEWDAEIVNDVPNRIIAWKTVGHPDVANAGSVNFKPATGGRGTVVSVVLDYEPPAGRIGAFIARLFGENPDRQVREDLRKFKQLMETGAITTSARTAEDSAYVGSSKQE